MLYNDSQLIAPVPGSTTPPVTDALSSTVDAASSIFIADPSQNDGAMAGASSVLVQSAVAFNASTDALNRSGAITSNSNYSVCGWVKYDSSTPDDSFIFVNNAAGTALALEFKTGVLRLVDTSGFVGIASVGSTLVNQKWYFVGYKINGTAATVYLGDESTAVITNTGTVAAQGASPTIWFSFNSSQFLIGALAFWKLYNAQLSDAEFEAERLRTTPARSTNLAGFWKFDSTANKTTDSSGNALTLTIDSTGPWEEAPGPSIPAFLQGGLLTNITMAGSSAGVSTATGTLTTSIRVAGASSGVSTASATSFSTNITAAGTSPGVATALGTLTTQILAAGTANGVATDSGTLTTNITMAGSSAGSATATGTLTTDIKAAGSSTALATALGTLTTAILLAGEADGIATALGTLQAGSPNIAGESDGVSTATGTLTTNIKFSGNAATASSATGTLTTDIRAAGAAVGTSLAQGTLTTDIRAAGSSAGVGTLAGALTTDIRLAGTSLGSSSAAADLFISKALAGSSSAGASAFATLTTNITMAGSDLAAAVASGSLATVILLAASSIGTSLAQGALTTNIPLSGSAGSGVSTANGALTTNIRLAGTAVGTSLAEADLFTNSDDILLAEGTSSATGALSTDIRMVGSVSIHSTASGDLEALITMAGNASGYALAIADLATVTQFAGTAAGRATPIGSLKTDIPLSGYANGYAQLGGLLLDINAGTGGPGDYGPIFMSGTPVAPANSAGDELCIMGDSVKDPRGVYIVRTTYTGTETRRIGELPVTRIRPAIGIHNSWIYFIGGLDGSGAETSSIYRARFDTAGNMGTPTLDIDLPYKDAASSVTFIGRWCYVVGSDRTIAKGHVNGDGRLDNWITRAA